MNRHNVYLTFWLLAAMTIGALFGFWCIGGALLNHLWLISGILGESNAFVGAIIGAACGLIYHLGLRRH